MARRRTVVSARGLRRALTLPEVALWAVLRGRPGGFKFRRQHPIGPYVVDFYCPAAKLAIEVDGPAHDMGDGPAQDERRDAWLRAQGFAVLRLPAGEVLRDLDAVLSAILDRCAFPLHHPAAPGGPPPRATHRED